MSAYIVYGSLGKEENQRFKAEVDDEKVSYLRKMMQTDGESWEEIACADKNNNKFSIYPKFGVDKSDEDRYRKIKEIYFDLSDDEFTYLTGGPFDANVECPNSIPEGIFPKGVGKNLEYGSGVLKKYSTIINAIESDTKCKKIYISDALGVEITGKIFRINRHIFEEHIESLDRQHRMVAQVSYKFKEVSSRNLVREANGEEKINSPKFRSPARKAASKAFSLDMSEDEFDEIADLFVESFPVLGRRFSKRIVSFQEEIMITSLNAVIEEADSMLENSVGEKKWQQFFMDYQIVLQQVFYAPIEIIQKEAYLRPTQIDGSGAVITDFLTVNRSTRSLILVEVKTPSASIIGSDSYRGQGESKVYPIHKNLACAISQLQGQIYSAQSHLSQMSGGYGLEHNMRLQGAIKGALIIGKLSDYSDLQKDSFSRFRADLHSVEIITYDELIDRLKSLRDLLLNINSESSEG